jgi:predicted DCC family thiol-disulfide oxidoreductase YuxK
MDRPDANIILFDGACNLCNRSVRFLIRHDRKAAFKFAALQTDAGRRLCREFGLDPDPDTLQSFILVRGERIYRRSDAALECVRVLGGAWRLLTIFGLLPRGLRDWAYAKLAQNRYRWFGRRDRCLPPDLSPDFSPETPSPPADWRARFLD